MNFFSSLFVTGATRTSSGGRSAALGGTKASQRSQDISQVTGLVLAGWIGLAFGLYFVLRYGGSWGENDSMVFVRSITALQATGSFFGTLRYDHGYAYSVWGASLSSLTGVPATELTRWFAPLLGNLFLALIAYALFRYWLASNRYGLMVTATMVLVPELAFTVSRNNHEKLTVFLTLLAILALLKLMSAFFEARRYWHFASWLLIFFSCIFVLASLNSLIGSLLTFSLTIAWVAAQPLVWFSAERKRISGYLILLAGLLLGAWLLLGLVVFYVYPQAGGKLQIIQTVIDNIKGMAGTRQIASNPYAEVTASTSTWVSPLVFRLLSLFRYLLFAVSGMTWLLLMLRALRNLHATSLKHLLLLALYGGFACLMAVTIPIDFSGIQYGSNLSVRFYSYFALLAVPLFVLGVSRALRTLGRFVPRPLLSTLALLSLTFFASTSMLKATLDPLVNNLWIHYWPEEADAVHFWDEHQEASFLYGQLRLQMGYVMRHTIRPANANVIDLTFWNPAMSHALVSDLQRAQAANYGVPPLPFESGNRVYDNGKAQLLHRPPQTPFQH